MYSTPQIIKIPSLKEERGNISFFEIGRDFDFDIKRVYYIYNIPHNATRGNHAHKKLKQIMLAIGGGVKIHLDNGIKKYEFYLSKPDEALYVPHGYYRILEFDNLNSYCFVFASEKYDRDDYIFDYQEFLEWKDSNL